MTRRRALLQLVRLPNLFTSAADVVAGFLFVGGGLQQASALAILAGASVCFYAGGAILNDVFDAARDAVERPGRPIPSGTIPRRPAAILGLSLLASGISLCAWQSRTAGELGLALAACIVCYDGLLKNTVLAPAIMGMCRAINLLVGMSIAQVLATPANLYAASLMWLYVASLTVFARHEANATSRLRLTLGSVGMLAAVVGLVGVQAFVRSLDAWYLILIGVLFGNISLHARTAIATGAPHDVQQAVRLFVLSIILFDACLVFATRGPLPAAAAAALLVPSIVLSRVYSVT